jgi:undecaprenyl-phosphate 4-deoxy-4-formamido-L-arabinose transferase
VIMDDDFQNPPERGDEARREDRGAVRRRLVRSTRRSSTAGGATSAARFNDRVATVMLTKPARAVPVVVQGDECRFVVREVVTLHGPYPYIDGLILRVTRNFTSVLCLHDRREPASRATR